MTILAAIRHRQKLWILRLAAPFAVVWLSMLWQPCAVAMEMDMGVDHGQHSCPHCPPPMHEECEANTTEECDYFDRFDTDRRGSKTKFGEAPEDVQLVLHSVCQLPNFPPPFAVHSSLSIDTTAPPGPPLNVLFCTYLN